MNGARLIALYKAYSGGEWFGPSLESVVDTTDGAVVVFSDRPWLPALDIECDCKEPLAEFQRLHPGYPVEVIVGSYTRQGEQYRAGLERIRTRWGADSRVLICDTDEVWPKASLTRLCAGMVDSDRNVEYFRVGIRTYLRSPTYQVWPQEAAGVLVGLRNAADRPIEGRFQGLHNGDNSMHVPAYPDKPDVVVHHFPYVRLDTHAMRAKLLNTSGQENDPSNLSWVDDVYAGLPAGENLHMTVGYENVWKRVRIVPLSALPSAASQSWACKEIYARECRAWRDTARAQTPEQAVWPQPRGDDAAVYRDLFDLPDSTYNALVSRLNCAMPEALALMAIASGVGPGGRIVEIGSGRGGSMACLALASHRSVELVSIDPFEPYDEETFAGTSRGVTEGDEDKFWDSADTFGFRSRVRQIKRRSGDASSLLPDGSVDVMLVDGNHSQEIVASDMRQYYPKLKPGGTIIGHDYTVRFPGVVRATDEWEASIGHPGLVLAGTSLYVARAPK